MKQRLILDRDLSMAELKGLIESGCRFVAFSYTISLVALTLKRFSPVILIESPQDFKRYKKRYNTISRIFGWWCIPWGPLRTSQSIRFNNKGGLDLTEDVMINITEADLANKLVDIKETTLLFIAPEKTDIKAFQKALAQHHNLRLHIERIVVGLYTNTDNPYFVVGIHTIGDYAQSCKDLRKAFYSQFLKSVRFEFIDLNEEHEWKELLEKQGQELSFGPSK